MTSRRWFYLMTAVWLGVLAAGATVWLLQRIAPTLWLFALGFILAYVMDPVLDRLEARGFSRGLAVAAVMVCFALVLVSIGLWVVPALVGQTQQLITHWPEYSAEIQTLYQHADTWARAYLAERYPDRDITGSLDARMGDLQVWGQARLPGLLRFASDTVVRSVSFTGLLLMVIFIGMNFMLVIDPFRRTLRQLLPGTTGEGVADISRQVSVMLGQYVRGQATMCLIMACLATLALVILGRIFGTQYGLVVGALAGLVYLGPWVGAFLTNVTAIIIGYVTAAHDPLLSAVCAMAAMTTINFVCDNVITPRIIGREVGLPPLVVIFSLLAGFQVLGVAGMIVATPVAASIKIILARWLPLQTVEPRKGRPAPLAFDLHAAARMILERVGRLGEAIEDGLAAVGGVEEPPDLRAEKPKSSKPKPPTDGTENQ
jgi:predicted PurR-regulated permease PerM